MRNWIYTSSVLALSLLFGAACSKEQDVASPQKLSFSISGSVAQPEWVDMEGDDDLRAFTLKPNDREYPKIDLPVVKERGFEPFVSVVWLFPQSLTEKLKAGQGGVDQYGEAVRIYVEDNGDPTKMDSHADKNTSNTSITGNSKGISRIISRDGRYRVLIGFDVQGRAQSPNNFNAMIGAFRPNIKYHAFIVLNPPIRRDPRNAGANNSIHRVHFPITHNVEGQDRTIPQLPPLRFVADGEVYTVGESTTSMADIEQPNATGYNPKTFNMPFFSRFGEDLVTEQRGNALTHGSAVQARFKMGGALLALKFRNDTNRAIKIKGLYTKSDHLAYSGYYELWPNINGKRYTNLKNSSFGNAVGVPFFSRCVNEERSTFLRGSVYKFTFRDALGKPLEMRVGPRQATNGRAYLWGGIDLDDLQAGKAKQTRCQVVYEYVDQPGLQFISKVVVLSQKPGGAKVDFEEGKAYLITVPIVEKSRI